MEPQHRSKRPVAGLFDGSVIEMFGDKIKRQNQLIARLRQAVEALPPECKARLAAHIERQEFFDEQETSSDR